MPSFSMVLRPRGIREVVLEDEFERTMLSDSTFVLDRAKKTVRMVDSIAVDLTNGVQLQRFRLQDGDSIYIPLRLNFVSVRGAVKNPGGHAVIPGRRAKYYLRQSGGFQTQAARRSLVVRYANGRSAEVRYLAGLVPIYPRVYSNSIIYVLPKADQENQSDPAQVAAISSIITSVSSMALGVFYLLRN